MPQLAAMVRAKFPGIYDDLSDADLERQVLAKHPEYADLVEPKYIPAERPRAQLGAGQRIMTEGPEQPPSALMQALQGAAHPQTWGDLASLAIPSALPTRAIRGMLRPAWQAIKDADAAASSGLSYPLSFAKQGIKGQLRKLNAPSISGESWSPISRTQPPIDRYAPNIGRDEVVLPRNEPVIPYASPTETITKPVYSAGDVLRIRDLMKQGVSQDMAVKIVQDLKDRGNEIFNRR